MTSSNWVLFLLVLPLVGGLIHWIKNKEIVWWEWALSFGAAILILVVTFWIAAAVGNNSKEVLSGRAHQAVHTPWWRAEWTELETYTTTDSKGNTQTHTRTVVKSETHQPKWWVETNIGDISISEGAFNKIVADHDIYKKKGRRPDFDRGDRYDYFSDIKDDPASPQYPVHRTFTWDNPLKGVYTIELGPEVSEEEAAQLGLRTYPNSGNPFISARVMGAPIDTYKWDQMCALLGPVKKVNLTIINFGGKGLETAVKQRDFWRNGQKNDLVLCYGEGWAYVFGWSANELVKQELQSLLLEKEVNDDILPAIDEIVRRDFERYDWHQHDDVPRPVSTWTVVIAFVLMVASQVGLGFLFHNNDTGKEGPRWKRALKRRP